MGPTGLAGIQGVVGSRGAEGPSREGPAGPVGATGATGAQGSAGYTGAQGRTDTAGVAGPAGATGSTGPQGMVGRTGAQGTGGPTGAQGNTLPSWNYTFRGNSEDILNSDSGKSREIASYMNQNPSSRITIRGPSNRYNRSVVDALTDAGVPAAKIGTGAFTDPMLRNNSRVDVIVSNQ